MRVRLTKRLVEQASTGKAAAFLWDEDLHGFGVCIRPSGTRTYVAQYRTRSGRTRRMTLGSHGPLSVDEARKLARQCLASAARGEDPAAGKREARHAPGMSDLLDLYVDRHVRIHNAASTQRTVIDLVDKCLRPALGSRSVPEISRRDILTFHQSLKATPRKANLALAALSKAFALAEQWQMRPEHSNPCRGVPRFPERHRERFLTPIELQCLGEALALASGDGLPWRRDPSRPPSRHLPDVNRQRTRIDPTALALIRALLLSGARLSEMLELERAHVQREAGLIALPSYKGGERKSHPMPDSLGRLLEAQLGSHASRWVFPRRSDPDRHLAKEVVENAWQRLRAHAGIADVRLHDLRHTVGTHAAASGASAFAIRDLLRHSGVAMTSRYVNYNLEPVRAVADQVSDAVSTMLDGGQ